jgi:hypothetical protein
MVTKRMKAAIIAGLIGYFSSFSVAAENTGVESTAPAKFLAVKTTAEEAVGGESSQSAQNQEMTEGRHSTSESTFELFSLEGVLSILLLIVFFLVFIKGKILKADR